MCIIIAKNKSDRLPTENELINSFEYNNDGAGFMYADNGVVVIDKGYMTAESFINRFKELCEKYNNFDNKCLVVHCRIGTSSGNTAKNTHPYPITYKENELHKTSFTCDLGMAHNGIISEYTPTWANPTTNDTQEFILKYVYPLYKEWPDFYKNKYILKGLKNITGSKLAFLDSNDNLYLVGDFIEDDNLKFSNTSYKSYRYSYNYGYSSSYTSTSSTYKYLGTEADKNDYEEPSVLDDSFDKPLDATYDYGYYYDKDIGDFDYSKMYLYAGYWLEYEGKCVEVGDDDLFVWDYNTCDLYTINSDYTLKLYATNVMVYNEHYEDIY